MQLKTIDTNLLVYSLIEGHPATEACEAFIREEGSRRQLSTTPLTPFEVCYVLWRVYGLERRKAFEKGLSLFEAPLDFVTINGAYARDALEKCVQYRIEANDGLLLQACLRYGIPSLATDDRSLMEACQNEGIYTECPIDENLREEMRRWEEEMLPKRGLPRILSRIYDWLLSINSEVAKKFEETTNNLRKLP